MTSASISVELLLYASLSLGVLLANLLEASLSALFVLFPLLFQALALLLSLFVDSLSVLSSALLVLFVALFTLLAPPLLLFLSGLLSSLVFLLFAPPAFLLLGFLFAFSLALLCQRLLSPGLPLFPPSIGFSCPFLFGLAAPLLLLGGCFSADFLNAIFAHFGQALLLDQAVQDVVNSVHNVSVNVATFSCAFDEGSGHSGVFGKQRRIAVGLAIDKFFKSGLEFIFGRLKREY